MMRQTSAHQILQDEATERLMCQLRPRKAMTAFASPAHMLDLPTSSGMGVEVLVSLLPSSGGNTSLYVQSNATSKVPRQARRCLVRSHPVLISSLYPSHSLGQLRTILCAYSEES